MVRHEPQDVVAAGYDRLGEDYLDWAGRIRGDPRDEFLDRFVALVPAGASVLDLGCGAGVPSTARLAERYAVIGVEVSAGQVELARRNVPGATFIQADMLDLAFDDRSYQGVTAFSSIIHMPRDQHRELFARVFRWLRPGGAFLAALGASDDPDATGDWLGVPMFFSSFDAATNRRLIETVGFQIVEDRVVTIAEPEGPVDFYWVLARRP